MRLAIGMIRKFAKNRLEMRKVALEIAESEYGAYYKDYIAKGKMMAEQMDLLQHGSGLVHFLKNVPDEKYEYRYSPEKWSIKEIVGHLIDTERIFAYRALCIARGEQGSLAGYDQDSYQRSNNAHVRPMEDLLEEFISVRVSTHHMFESFNDKVMCRLGNANGQPMSVRAAYLFMYGHSMHHIVIVKERYLG